jgi:TRAP transporter TAXI family solute receptor
MRYKVTVLLSVVLSGLFFGFSYAAEGIGMVTGSSAGTYIQFGKNISEVAGVDILVKESEGSIANIRRMASKENAALGIVQSDVLGFLARSKSPEMKKVSRNIRMIFPFYNEEVHLFANRSVRWLADLQGKRVVLGKKGSGNWLTGTNLLQIAGVQPAEIQYLSPTQAVTAVLEGRADAMFYVAGKPVKLFTALGALKEKPKYAPLFADVHFVPITEPAVLKEYVPSQIGTSDYSWLYKDTPTVAVKAVLVSFDFSSSNSPYYRQRCQELSILGKGVRDNLEKLKQTGHPKWQEVDLEENVGIWQLDNCSRSLSTAASGAVIGESLEEALLKELSKE